MERAILKFFLLFCITLGVINIVLFLPKKTPDKPAIPSPIPSKLTDVLKQIPAPQVFPAEFTPPPPRTDFPAAPTLVKSDDTSLRQEAINYPFEIYNPLPVANSYRYGTKFAPPPSLVPMVEFWRNVYARYNPHHSILHDAQNLSIVYGVIDFEPLESKTLLPKRIKQQWREDIQEEKRETIIDMLLSFHEGNTPKTESEKIIYQLLDKIEGKNKFKNAAERVRIQQGQKSLFEKGIVRSGRYMDQIKRVFARIGVPEEIANLVFVESMFQVDAVSKTGAAGPWQLMPQTGKRFLTINDVVDERRDPVKAAEAAAKHLKRDFDSLKSWPLAINAYNTGPGRMRQAVRTLYTHDIATIIHSFEDKRGYGFASRNFYPEFLAALEVANHHQDYFGTLVKDSPVRTETLHIPFSFSLNDLAMRGVADLETLKILNPTIRKIYFEKNRLLPGGLEIQIPYGQRGTFLSALSVMKSIAP